MRYDRGPGRCPSSPRLLAHQSWHICLYSSYMWLAKSRVVQIKRFTSFMDGSIEHVITPSPKRKPLSLLLGITTAESIPSCASYSVYAPSQCWAHKGNRPTADEIFRRNDENATSNNQTYYYECLYQPQLNLYPNICIKMRRSRNSQSTRFVPAP